MTDLRAGAGAGGLRSRTARFLAYLVRLPSLIVVVFLRLYQLVVSPLYGSTCRFYPSCSQYALLSVQRHGVVRGARLTAWRLLRCNPWNPGGVDDVPPGRAPTQSAHPAHPHH